MATETLADIRDSAAAYREALGLVRRLIEIVGDDPDRPGLVDTPARVVRSWGELYSGYRLEETIPDLLRTFESPSAGDTTTVIVNDIPFTSLCEHHMLPFTGTVNIRYTPAQGLVLGLSKLPRLVGVIAARLQIQERIAADIGGALLGSPAVAEVNVEVTAVHHCLTARGVRAHGASMTTHWRGGRSLEWTH